MSTFGISDNSFNILIATIEKYPEIEQAKIFGSRAMGNYKKGSDIDIALFGKNIDWNLITEIHTQLNEVLDVPYYFDIVDYQQLNNPELKNHIDLEGIEIFSRNI